MDVIDINKDMKVLQVNCVYGKGSTGKITRDLHLELQKRGIESVVCYGRGDRVREPGVYKTCGELYSKINNLLSRFTGIMYGGCFFSTNRLIRIIRKEQPDVVHLQCINGYFVNIYRLLNWLKNSRIKTVLTLHAEFMYTGNCGHALDCEKWKTGCGNCPRLRQETKSCFVDGTHTSWTKFHKLYHNWDDLYVVACSEWIQKRALQCGEMKNRNIRVIRNGIDNETLFFPRINASERIKEQYKISREKKLILYVAPGFSELKGFDYLLRLIENMKDLPYHFILVGDQKHIEKENVTELGKILDQDYLAELYSAADVLVMCSQCDNYPTVCLEASSCGTPVAGFDVGGVRETIPKGMGDTVKLGDLEGMEALINKICNCERVQASIESGRRGHSKQRMAKEYFHCYYEILQ